MKIWRKLAAYCHSPDRASTRLTWRLGETEIYSKKIYWCHFHCWQWTVCCTRLYQQFWGWCSGSQGWLCSRLKLLCIPQWPPPSCHHQSISWHHCHLFVVCPGSDHSRIGHRPHHLVGPRSDHWGLGQRSLLEYFYKGNVGHTMISLSYSRLAWGARESKKISNSWPGGGDKYISGFVVLVLHQRHLAKLISCWWSQRPSCNWEIARFWAVFAVELLACTVLLQPYSHQKGGISLQEDAFDCIQTPLPGLLFFRNWFVCQVSLYGRFSCSQSQQLICRIFGIR